MHLIYVLTKKLTGVVYSLKNVKKKILVNY